ncbi:DUF2946 domain-containing protein [Caballeronia sp. LZ033]|uniref:DUF2946 domain-containing protein n=1 Tax=Caballeronia sp. LZ033 TaxID=3038566 RepID=UPI002856299C|nr:DUF2946 domain-containing protein [Caballeronia sp. LZ033]MDR5818762.1 DUF2946 domain-containing protein [Caballeronia sp. LZ033]
MTIHAHRRLSAWLGIIAMCLITLVPLVSQMVQAHQAQQPAAVLCSSDHQSHQARQSEDMLSACAYCDLLTTHAAMPSVPPRVDMPVILAIASAVLILSVRFIPSGAFPSGRPRGPPVFS